MGRKGKNPTEISYRIDRRIIVCILYISNLSAFTATGIDLGIGARSPSGTVASSKDFVDTVNCQPATQRRRVIWGFVVTTGIIADSSRGSYFKAVYIPYDERSIIKAVDKAGISIGPARFLGNFNDDRIGFHINPCS